MAIKLNHEVGTPPKTITRKLLLHRIKYPVYPNERMKTVKE